MHQVAEGSKLEILNIVNMREGLAASGFVEFLSPFTKLNQNLLIKIESCHIKE